MLQYLYSKLLKKIQGVAIRNSTVDRSSKIEPGTLFFNSKMGKHSFCGYDCEIVNASIGSYCSISSNVVIGGGMHPTSWVSSSPVFYAGRDSIKAKFSEFERDPVKRVVIGNDVWIGRSVIIKQGVNIGHGAVVGMGAIVTKDVEPYSIVGGNPAKIIKYRFNDELIRELLDSFWWEIDEKLLSELAVHIRDPKLFLSKLKE